jgi:hypothetical protein
MDICDLPLDMRHEILNWYDKIPGSTIAYCNKSLFVTYGPTPTRKLLILSAGSCNLSTFSQLEAYFDYEYLEYPKELFISAIRGNNLQFIFDCIDSKYKDIGLIFDGIKNFEPYILYSIGKWTTLDSFKTFVQKYLPQGFEKPWFLVFNMRISIMGAFATANYQFIRDALNYCVTIRSCRILYLRLYRQAINTHNKMILDIMDEYKNIFTIPDLETNNHSINDPIMSALICTETKISPTEIIDPSGFGPLFYILRSMSPDKWVHLGECPTYHKCEIVYTGLRFLRAHISAKDILTRDSYHIYQKLKEATGLVYTHPRFGFSAYCRANFRTSWEGLFFFCSYKGLDVVRYNYQVAIKKLLDIDT